MRDLDIPIPLDSASGVLGISGVCPRETDDQDQADRLAVKRNDRSFVSITLGFAVAGLFVISYVLACPRQGNTREFDSQTGRTYVNHATYSERGVMDR